MALHTERLLDLNLKPRARHVSDGGSSSRVLKRVSNVSSSDTLSTVLTESERLAPSDANASLETDTRITAPTKLYCSNSNQLPFNMEHSQNVQTRFCRLQTTGVSHSFSDNMVAQGSLLERAQRHQQHQQLRLAAASEHAQRLLSRDAARVQDWKLRLVNDQNRIELEQKTRMTEVANKAQGLLTREAARAERLIQRMAADQEHIQELQHQEERRVAHRVSTSYCATSTLGPPPGRGEELAPSRPLGSLPRRCFARNRATQAPDTTELPQIVPRRPLGPLSERGEELAPSRPPGSAPGRRFARYQATQEPDATEPLHRGEMMVPRRPSGPPPERRFANNHSPRNLTPLNLFTEKRECCHVYP
ncbi:hypothetical protein WMY93_023074 [Mugilogobius chulae]|uniref:Uncharacterized protein n=1 Tax=Mugilogobius chulae TaxID=88201 RepID=A0AAW0N4U6_9GOBI